VLAPPSGYEIGDGYEVLVLYASPGGITLKYTREDNVLYGYTLHLDGLCVDPRLLDLYRDCDRQGRGRLPAVRAGQPVGCVAASEVRFAIRDSGAFMDPRSRKDWWQDYGASTTHP
jgi:hypothetical protein